MKKTPETVSQARKRLRAEMEVWRAGIAAARRDISLGVNTPAENLLKVQYGELKLAACKKKMGKLCSTAKKQFWPY
jgi:hypothetical protein